MKSRFIKQDTAEGAPGPGRQLLLGLLFGFIFGFLLQKGGVAKYEILVGALLLRDFTVFKVMLSAIILGMIGTTWLARRGKIKLQPKPTRFAANIIGGLIFGIGFGLAGYCPGTTSAAFGQGNFDALAVMFGMMLGSYLYAAFSTHLQRGIFKMGDRGKLTLPQALHLPALPVALALACTLIAALIFLEWIEPVRLVPLIP